MPTYAYACTSCGNRFDAVQSFSDAALTECPECGGRLRKEYGSIGVTFNGSGFYRTDSRSDAKSGKGGEKSTGEKSTGEKKTADAPASGGDGGAKTPSRSGSKTEAKASPAPSGS